MSAADEEAACPGSFALAVDQSPGGHDWVGRCPVCGALLELGYAALVPLHELATVVGPRPSRR